MNSMIELTFQDFKSAQELQLLGTHRLIFMPLNVKVNLVNLEKKKTT